MQEHFRRLGSPQPADPALRSYYTEKMAEQDSPAAQEDPSQCLAGYVDTASSGFRGVFSREGWPARSRDAYMWPHVNQEDLLKLKLLLIFLNARARHPLSLFAGADRDTVAFAFTTGKIAPAFLNEYQEEHTGDLWGVDIRTRLTGRSVNAACILVRVFKFSRSKSVSTVSSWRVAGTSCTM